jgi:hypothetical protein
LPFQAFANAHNEQTPETAMVKACRDIRESGKELQPPIGLSNLLKLFRARLDRQFIWYPGRLDIDDKGYHVIVNRRHDWRRQRFTVAHEIGHIIVFESLADAPHLLQALREPENARYLEKLCDFAAAELLMPVEDVLTNLRKLDSEEGFRRLYDRYLCSRLAILQRIADVVPELTVSLWKEFSRHPKEAVEWRVERCFYYRRKAWVPNGMTAAKHLMPNLIREAAAHGTSSDAKLGLRSQLRISRVCGLAFDLNPRKVSGVSQPRFQGMEVPDEPSPEKKVALLMWPMNQSESSGSLLPNLSQ